MIQKEQRQYELVFLMDKSSVNAYKKRNCISVAVMDLNL